MKLLPKWYVFTKEEKVKAIHKLLKKKLITKERAVLLLELNW